MLKNRNKYFFLRLLDWIVKNIMFFKQKASQVILERLSNSMAFIAKYYFIISKLLFTKAVNASPFNKF